jgi:hypothetical protein
MRVASGEKKDFDLFGMGACGAVIGKSGGTARHYARQLRARGVAGILLATTGDYYATSDGLAAIKKESERPGRSMPERV